MSIITPKYTGTIIVVVLLLSGCGDRGSEHSSTEQRLNQAVNRMHGEVTGGENAFVDLMGSIGKKLDEVSKTSTEQQKMLDQTLKDYVNDRQQIQGVFGSIADRLDQVDKSILSLQKRYEEIDKKVQGFDEVGNNKGSE